MNPEEIELFAIAKEELALKKAKLALRREMFEHQRLLDLEYLKISQERCAAVDPDNTPT